MRGLKNNNPGNIIKSGSKFQGEIKSTDPKFKQFEKIEYGYRAVFVLLTNYINKGFDTISKIISKYAPSTENDTVSYINTVSKLTGINSNAKINSSDPSTMIKIVAAISRVENGVAADISQVSAGWDLLLKKK